MKPAQAPFRFTATCEVPLHVQRRRSVGLCLRNVHIRTGPPLLARVRVPLRSPRSSLFGLRLPRCFVSALVPLA